MFGQPGHNTQPHARLPSSFLGMDVWMTLQLNVALIRKVREFLMCLTLHLTCYRWVFVQSGTDRRRVDWCRN